jgi:uncharacterized protein YecA (UPF0149 family)
MTNDDDRITTLADDPALARPPKHTPSTSSQKAGKVGRHDPCPCGSGRKVKRCCLWRATR